MMNNNRNENNKEFELCYFGVNKTDLILKNLNKTELSKDEAEISQKRLDTFVNTINNWIKDCTYGFLENITKEEDDAENYANLKNLKIERLPYTNESHYNKKEEYNMPSIGIHPLRIKYNSKSQEYILDKNITKECMLYLDTMGRFENDNIPTIIITFNNCSLKLKCFNFDDNMITEYKVTCYLYLIFKKALSFYNTFINSELQGVELLILNNIDNDDADFKYLAYTNETDIYEFTNSQEDFIKYFDEEDKMKFPSNDQMRRNVVNLNNTNNLNNENDILIKLEELLDNNQNINIIDSKNIIIKTLISTSVNKINQLFNKAAHDSDNDNVHNASDILNILKNIDKKFYEYILNEFINVNVVKEITENLSIEFQKYNNHNNNHQNNQYISNQVYPQNINTIRINDNFDPKKISQYENMLNDNVQDELAITLAPKIEESYEEKGKIVNFSNNTNNTTNEINNNIKDERIGNKIIRTYLNINGKNYRKEIQLPITSLKLLKNKINYNDTRLNYIYDYYMTLMEKNTGLDFVNYFIETTTKELQNKDLPVFYARRGDIMHDLNCKDKPKSFKTYKIGENKELIPLTWGEENLNATIANQILPEISRMAFGEQGSYEEYLPLAEALTFEFKIMLRFYYLLGYDLDNNKFKGNYNSLVTDIGRYIETVQ